MKKFQSCSICACDEFGYSDVLWPKLIQQWQLDEKETEYINRQQGFYCESCRNCLRVMALAEIIVSSQGAEVSLAEFCVTASAKAMKLLDINGAGNLDTYLSLMPGYKHISYPEYDVQCLPFESGVFDMVIHSDTLEHVPDPTCALKECYRVLRPKGKCIFTIPIIVNRMSLSRKELNNSHHGNADTIDEGYLVRTEFGADFWKYVLRAGFSSLKLHSIEYPAALVIEAIK